jgi:hypothetical protein
VSANDRDLYRSVNESDFSLTASEFYAFWAVPDSVWLSEPSRMKRKWNEGEPALEVLYTSRVFVSPDSWSGA